MTQAAPIGLELNVGGQMAGSMSVEVEFLTTASDGIVTALPTGTVNVTISDMSCPMRQPDPKA
ncbi:hypothetical protein [Roseicyclus marinus]